MPKPQKGRKKLLLAAPVSLRWPTVDDDCRSQLLERFRNIIAACESKTTPYWAVGINAATRALEKGQLSALILNSSADPPRLLHGIIRLARGTSTPVLCVSQLQEWMPSLGSLLALGLRRATPASKPVDAFLNAVRQNAPSDPAKGPEDERLVDSDKRLEGKRAGRQQYRNCAGQKHGEHAKQCWLALGLCRRACRSPEARVHRCERNAIRYARYRAPRVRGPGVPEIRLALRKLPCGSRGDIETFAYNEDEWRGARFLFCQSQHQASVL
ncbi:hypothetical protein HPB48_011627 [Haemaphysalis longicornis]|uniref:Ribosomal protein L7Ae/L30e/S12e/Gadd45 domain-containing protein n=1 Tax=Haemaphysalis longicornis TaxID=44386 RepID=A0A9J6G2R3_HAELO|nr:hypothetical protein HPB48_011627 [Haemaphysalis longicornis]